MKASPESASARPRHCRRRVGSLPAPFCQLRSLLKDLPRRSVSGAARIPATTPAPAAPNGREREHELLTCHRAPGPVPRRKSSSSKTLTPLWAVGVSTTNIAIYVRVFPGPVFPASAPNIIPGAPSVTAPRRRPSSVNHTPPCILRICYIFFSLRAPATLLLRENALKAGHRVV